MALHCSALSELPAHSKVLVPFSPEEAISVSAAAAELKFDPATVRRWALQYSLGRKIGSYFKISRVALKMFADGDDLALAAYLRGDRSSPAVIQYFDLLGIPIGAALPPCPQAKSHRAEARV